jgi:RNA polymerase sigma-70 factor (ECF subfamily)
MDLRGVDDATLLGLVASGDQPAVGELYDRYHRPCYSFAVRMVGGQGEAEEIVQETFVRAWRSALNYDASRASVQSWLLSITRNLCIDELRRRRRRAAETPGLDNSPEPAAAERTDIEAERAILGEQVRGALQTLSPEQRSAIELVYFHGLTSQEVGQALNVPAPTVRSRLRLGLLKLAAVLEEKGVTSNA